METAAREARSPLSERHRGSGEPYERDPGSLDLAASRACSSGPRFGRRGGDMHRALRLPPGLAVRPAWEIYETPVREQTCTVRTLGPCVEPDDPLSDATSVP